MTAFSALAAALVLLSAPEGAAQNTVLVEFSTQQCTHCKAMEPILAKLAEQGCQVQVVDVSQRPEIVQQFRITGVPTFVALSAGRETGRVVGSASYERLAELFTGAGGRMQRSEVGGQGIQPTDYRRAEAGPVAGGASPAGKELASAATVRLKVEDASGFGFGTGTIIDTHDGEALVVTCGHLFRESQGKGAISADVFGGGAGQTVAGQLIAYDLDRDIALVSLRVPMTVRAAQVAPPGCTVRPGDRVFSIGCDKGADPSVRPTHITAVNKYMGRPNYTAAGQPIDGRSGGGLFTAEGLLIGICNAADPADDEGLYAGLASIHWQLDQIGQSEIYQRSAGGVAAAPPPPAAPLESPAMPQLPAQMPGNQLASVGGAIPGNDPLSVRPTAFGGAAYDLGPLAATGDDAEIVFIIRSKSNPQKQSEMFLVDQAPPDLVARITHAARTTGEQRAALAQARSGGSGARPAAYQPGPGGPIVRGQSAD